MRWIKLYHGLLTSEIWLRNEPFTYRSAFVHVLLSANWKDGKAVYAGKAIEIKRGQWLTSIRNLGTTFKWSNGKVLRWLNAMELYGMITSQSVGCGTLLTVVNYEKYQGENSFDYLSIGTQTEQERNADGIQYKNKNIEERQKEDINASVNAREAGSGPEAVPARREEVGAKSPYPSHDDDDEDDDCLPPEEAIARWLATHPAQTTS